MRPKLMVNSVRGALRMLAVTPPDIRRRQSARRRKLTDTNAALLTRVVRVPSTYGASELADQVEDGLDKLGLAQNLQALGSTCLLMGNFNSDDPYPASSDLRLLEVMLEQLRNLGLEPVIGGGAGLPWFPSRDVLKSLGVLSLAARHNTEVWITDESTEWVEVPTPMGDWSLIAPQRYFEFDAIVYMPLLRVHRFAGFSQGMKLGMGIIHPATRRNMHIARLEEKIAAMAAVLQPDLLIGDGRRAFVTGGPEAGQEVAPDVLLFGSDLVTMEVQGMRELARAAEEADASLGVEPYRERSIEAALELGVSEFEPGPGEFEVVEA